MLQCSTPHSTHNRHVSFGGCVVLDVLDVSTPHSTENRDVSFGGCVVSDVLNVSDGNMLNCTQGQNTYCLCLSHLISSVFNKLCHITGSSYRHVSFGDF